MNIVLQHIEYLLLHKDCVILPGVGAFLANVKPSALINESSPDDALFTAPCREFCFNSEITATDGLLANSIARSLDISYEKASSIVSREAASIRSQIINTGEVAIGKIGLLNYDTRANAIVFTPNRQGVPTTFTPWLPEVCATPIAHIIKQHHQEETIAETLRSRRFRAFRRIAGTAAAIAMLIGIGFTLTTPISVDNATLASLSVPKVSKIEQSALIPKAPGSHSSALSLVCASDSSILFVESQHEQRSAYRENRNTKKEARTFVTPSSNVQAMPDMSIDESHSFCVIIASLASQEDADKYLASHNGNFGILAKDGKYRIYCATASSSAQAQRIAASSAVKGQYPGAWVCSR